MSRLILTFETLLQVLKAEKALHPNIKCRPTPTPPGLTTSICGIALELLDHRQQDAALKCLGLQLLEPSGIHEIE
ncbi:MAG: DUF3343 domain-containing protein [Candidatus Melainabacteria bacterium]|nr:DUF3343 domain-containing protein [Candidatus Melainabacteria bacterium]